MIKVLFTEKQKFRQKWLIFFVVITLAFAAWGFIQQIILGRPFGNNPAPDGLLILFVLVPVVIFSFILSLTLHTRIDQHGITYRYAPVHRKSRLIKWELVKSCYVREYRPIAEYGGWGFRRGRSGMAFNVSGSKGLQIIFKDGKKMLLGTQKPDELGRVLEKLHKAKPEN